MEMTKLLIDDQDLALRTGKKGRPHTYLVRKGGHTYRINKQGLYGIMQAIARDQVCDPVLFGGSEIDPPDAIDLDQISRDEAWVNVCAIKMATEKAAFEIAKAKSDKELEKAMRLVKDTYRKEPDGKKPHTLALDFIKGR